MKVLVLNSAYQPINVTTLQRGFNLVFKGKAEIVEHDDDRPIVTDQKVYRRPLVIRIFRAIQLPFRKVPLTRHNIFRRDDGKCVYCGSKNTLTLDHVTPKSKGGPNTWKNLVTCCGECNVKKGDMYVDDFLEMYNLEMSHAPFVPSYLYFVDKMSRVHNSWKLYVGIVV